MKSIFDRVNDRANSERLLELARQDDSVVFVWGTGQVAIGKGYNLLKKQGIRVNFFCDSNSLKHGEEILDGIKCVSPQLMKEYNNVVCFVLVGIKLLVEIVDLLELMGITNYLSYDEMFFDDQVIFEYLPFMKTSQIAVYTCVVGDYDKLIEPKYISDGCDYYYISDKECDKNSVYKWLDINQFIPEYVTDNTRKNRYCKLNAHKIFPQYKYSIYVDGNVEILNDVSRCLAKIGKSGMAVTGKVHWGCLYLEAARLIENQKDNAELIRKQVQRYYEEGMPRYYGGLFCNILVREHNTTMCMQLMEDWWNEVMNESRRDQLSLPYVLWKNNLRVEDVGILTEEYYLKDNPYFKCDFNHND